MDNVKFDCFCDRSFIACSISVPDRGQLVFDWVRLLNVRLDTVVFDDQVGTLYGKVYHLKSKGMNREQQGSNALAPKLIPGKNIEFIMKLSMFYKTRRSVSFQSQMALVFSIF